MIEEQVILVDGADNEVGNAEKLYAHQQGLLHRAISVFIFNSKGEWLLQKRAANKYHSGGLWTNSCCSHPRPGEETADAAKRRLKEEMGIECELKFLFSFRYRAEVGNDLIEHELDHVFIGTSDQTPNPDANEAEAFQYFNTGEIAERLKTQPEAFTVWFVKIFDKVRQTNANN
jgi:isopentenyl-diphosphate delta-isomerase